MIEITQSFVEKITEYKLSANGQVVEGFYEIEPRVNQLFRVEGKDARKLHKKRVAWEETQEGRQLKVS